MKKGFFPYRFNTFLNQKYVGKYPSIDYYDINNMKDNKSNEFLEFYVLNKDKIFDFQKELLSYCISDVDILKNGYLTQRLFLKKCSKSIKNVELFNGIDPYLNAITLPSYCHKLYRNILMEDKSIAVIPEGGLSLHQASSKKCIVWLEFLNYTNHLEIRHSYNGTEFKVLNFKLDGYDKIHKIGYEFHGW